MWPVTNLFLEALRKPQKRITTGTYTVPGGEPVEIRFKSGRVSLSDQNRIRRRADITVFGRTADYQAMMTPGTLFRIEHGLRMGNITETVPVFCGEVNRGRQLFGGGAGEIVLPLLDLGGWLARSDFVEPFAPSAGTTRIQAITDVVQDARPGTTVIVTATDTGTIGRNQMWTGSRWDCISDLTADGGTEAFFQPDGTFLIRNQPTLSTPSSWSPNGVLSAAARERPMERLYNTVVVRPSATDGSQTWTQQVVSITDPAHERHPDKIGVVPYFLPSPTASTAAIAQRAGQLRLSRVLGTSETLNLGLISNPALEGGDVIRVVTPQIGNEPANIFQHIVDSFAFDVMTGGMSLSTRAQEAS